MSDDFLGPEWKRGLCDRLDCKECIGARQGCTWNPYACQVSRDEREQRRIAALPRDPLTGSAKH